MRKCHLLWMLIQLDASFSLRTVFELKINVIKRITNGSPRASSLSILDERAGLEIDSFQ